MEIKTDKNSFQVEARLAIIGGERDLIVKEQAEEEARIRNAKLEELKRRRWVDNNDHDGYDGGDGDGEEEDAMIRNAKHEELKRRK